MSTITQRTPVQAGVARAYGPLLGIALIGSLFCWVFSDFLLRQARSAIESPADWGHTLAIPFIAGYFISLQRDKLLAQPFRTTWLGMLPLILGLAIYLLFVFGPTRHHNLQGAGCSIALFGLVLLFFGFRAMKYLWFPLAYLCVFGQTVSQSVMTLITFQLQDIAARGSYYGLMLLGLDIDRNGNSLTIFHAGKEIPLNIAEACSGMRMLMAFLALGVAMAVTGFTPRRPARSIGFWFDAMMAPAEGRPVLRALLATPVALISVLAAAADLLLVNWQRVLLVLLAVPTAIFVNVLRVMTLGLLSLVDSGLAAGDFHSFIGLLWLVPAFMIYLGVMWILRKLVIEVDEPARPAAVLQPAAGRNKP